MRVNRFADVLCAAIVALGVYLSASAAGAQVVFWIEPKNGFQAVSAEDFEKIKRLERSVFVSELKQDEIAIQDFKSENRIYRVLRFCPHEYTTECFTSFYRDDLADENLFLATRLPGITAAQYDSFFFCKDCGESYQVWFFSPNRPLSPYACPTIAYLTDDRATLNFGAGCSN
ncbi:hypothetical protein [Hoeflea poritis]|uniref:Uncharacterized protein n=1 Tax=Hoeflea poritis TaxID=2993659 RepID=A0ABT4VH10_9HYPH|nr:hypothetical protein [Hoeflea poritis]MDA4843993.1 hypothetical protein [Hoeflea poritis]